MSEKHIHIKGARVNNLKNLEVKIQHGKLTVITGLSGSGKSSLAFDTLYAEGQRRYIESLSSYARQFLGKLDKPEVDFIKGVAPAIAIQQKVISTNPRSTVGTNTEIYDYLKLLFTRIGKTISPISGKEVKKHTITDVIDRIKLLGEEERVYILAPILNFVKYGFEKQLKLLKEQGYARVFQDGEIFDLEDFTEKDIKDSPIYLLVDRIQYSEDEELLSRLADSISLAFDEGNGEMFLYFLKDASLEVFNNRFELDGMEFTEPSEHFFTFNNPFGACKTCEGFGSVIGIDPKLVIPNTSLSVYEGAVVAWRGDTMKEYLNELIYAAPKFNFPIHRPIDELTEKEYEVLWKGNKHFSGINGFFKFVESHTYKIQYRVMLSRFRGKTICPDCHGTKLRKDANYVKVNGYSITEMVLKPIDETLELFKGLKVDQKDEKIAKRLLPEITNRLQFLNDVGLGYLTLNRQSNSLSGGESQRINLATSLGSALVGSMYILDEPSIGLHPRDTEKLVGVLLQLRDLGNTVIIVEHEEAIMRAADEIIDIGPMAGIFGGEVVFQGTHKQLVGKKKSLTAQYLTGAKKIEIPSRRRKSTDFISVLGAKQNNLKNIDVKIPLHELVCITGVSGSGKSTLIRDLVYPLVRRQLGQHGDFIGSYSDFTGDFKKIKDIQFIDQNPIGKSSRSNPVTYVKAFDDIRDLFAKTSTGKAWGLKPGYFSFNVDGGRCEMCEGEGEITISMQFMADVKLPCEACMGRRYKQEALEVLYREKSIADILEMDIEAALQFFQEGGSKADEKIANKIQPLVDVGLGYLKMGQASSTLSGGEAQRVKLASFLSKSDTQQGCLFIFDEPTTGLHFYDIEKLLLALQRLVDQGNSVLVIEHNLEVIKCADWIIDLGPEGGSKGGNLAFAGTPEDLVKDTESYTAQYLRELL